MGDAPPLASLILVHKAIVYKTYSVRFRKGLMLCSKWDVNSCLLCDHHLCDPTQLHPTQQHREFSKCITPKKKRKAVGCTHISVPLHSPIPSFPSWETQLTHILCEDHHFIWLIWKQANACKVRVENGWNKKMAQYTFWQHVEAHSAASITQHL